MDDLRSDEGSIISDDCHFLYHDSTSRTSVKMIGPEGSLKSEENSKNTDHGWWYQEKWSTWSGWTSCEHCKAGWCQLWPGSFLIVVVYLFSFFFLKWTRGCFKNKSQPLHCWNVQKHILLWYTLLSSINIHIYIYIHVYWKGFCRPSTKYTSASTSNTMLQAKC